MSIFGIASQECSLTVCRCVTEVSLEGNKSSCFTLVLQLHAGGGGHIWMLSYEFPRSSKRQIYLSETVIPVDSVPQRLTLLLPYLLYDWYHGPRSCECTFRRMFCWLKILCGGMQVSAPSVTTMCSVLLSRIASSKLQPRATISMHRNWTLYEDFCI